MATAIDIKAIQKATAGKRVFAPYCEALVDGAALPAKVSGFSAQRSIVSSGATCDLVFEDAGADLPLAEGQAVALHAGYRGIGSFLFFTGQIDKVDRRPEFRVWLAADRALSQTKIKETRLASTAAETVEAWLSLAGVSDIDIDLPPQKLRHAIAREAAVKSAFDMLRSHLAERAWDGEILGEDFPCWHFTAEGKFVWRRWESPGADRFVFTYGQNIGRLDPYRESMDEKSHETFRLQTFPMPWVNPGDEADVDHPRLGAKQTLRVDSHWMTQNDSDCRSELFLRKATS